MKNIILNILVFSFIVATACLAGINNTSALTTADLWGDADIQADVTDELGLPDKDPREVIAAVVRFILGFLGIIAVLIILAGGFKYMTSGGAEDKIEESKKLMTSGVIGLIIILASFGLASFVIDSLVTATGIE